MKAYNRMLLIIKESQREHSKWLLTNYKELLTLASDEKDKVTISDRIISTTLEISRLTKEIEQLHKL